MTIIEKVTIKLSTGKVLKLTGEEYNELKSEFSNWYYSYPYTVTTNTFVSDNATDPDVIQPSDGTGSPVHSPYTTFVTAEV